MKKFKTLAGVQIEVAEEAIEADSALQNLIDAANNSKAGIFSSGFDYPGRHSRWDIAFSNPALEFISKKQSFEFNALNEQGVAVLSLIAEHLKNTPELKEFCISKEKLSGSLITTKEDFTEEERSRQPSIFSILRKLNYIFGNRENGHFGLYGAFGYDLVHQFESLKLRLPRDEQQADCRLFLPLSLVVIDRKLEKACRYSFNVHTPLGQTADLRPGGKKYELPKGTGEQEVVSDHKPGEFAEKVKTIIEGTKKGDYFEVVLSQSFSARFDSKPSQLFQRLAEINPSPYMFLLNFGDELLVGASPEIYVRVTDRRYETCPIAGTVRRGNSALEDADQVRELLLSNKEESELTMCTDVDRNDMARVCIPGSVRIIGRRQLEFYSHLIHTVDHLEGTLADQYDGLDAFQTHMWACTVTGAPKPAAMQAIEDLENSPRAWFSGAVGFLSFNGDINTGITLRFAHIKNGRAKTRAGATLLFGSNPELEEQETRTKSAAFLAALAHSQQNPSTIKTEQLAPQIRISGKTKKILFVDCRDSFVHNLASYMRELGAEVVTLRAGFPVEKISKIAPDLVLLSPGPATPEEFGIPALVKELSQFEIPTFGVCLGLQGIGQYFGAKLSQLPIPFHGKSSLVEHKGNLLFKGIPERFEAGRYHSLYLINDSIPECLEVTATGIYEHENGSKEIIPMAIRHKTKPIAAVQFHPESLMTLKKSAGHLILKNAVETLIK